MNSVDVFVKLEVLNSLMLTKKGKMTLEGKHILTMYKRVSGSNQLSGLLLSCKELSVRQSSTVKN